MNWSDLGLAPQLLSAIEKAGYKAPTPVQAAAIPHAIEGHDVLASAATGSGKTAGFVLPTVQRYIGKEGTYVLALSPTREIAQQTAAVFETFGAPLGLRSTVLIGGANMRTETEALGTYPQIIVATPGRLCDHLERGNIWLDFIKTLILDEADRMLDMGFSDQLAKITDQIPRTRQTLMFSATFPHSIERLAKKVMNNPKEVKIGSETESKPQIEQRWLGVAEEDKLDELMRLFKQEPGTIVVFAKSKDKVSRVWRSLHSRLIYDATYIHSDCTQAHREKAIADFKSGAFRILIATDVAGRGIDVDDVAHVVNFDLPMEPEDYVHRIGRTGRRGKKGIATSFVTDRDRQTVAGIERIMKSRDENFVLEMKGRPGPAGERTSERGGRGGNRGDRGRGGRTERGGRGGERSAPREAAPRAPAVAPDPNAPRVKIELKTTQLKPKSEKPAGPDSSN